LRLIARSPAGTAEHGGGDQSGVGDGSAGGAGTEDSPVSATLTGVRWVNRELGRAAVPIRYAHVRARAVAAVVTQCY